MHRVFIWLMMFGRAASYGVWPSYDDRDPPRRRNSGRAARKTPSADVNNDCFVWL